MILAEAVAPGGPSAPAWAFFTAISLAVLEILRRQIATKRDVQDARNETVKARVKAEQAVKNTETVSNGFTARIERKLDRLADTQQEILRWQRDHLQHHNERY